MGIYEQFSHLPVYIVEYNIVLIVNFYITGTGNCLPNQDLLDPEQVQPCPNSAASAVFFTVVFCGDFLLLVCVCPKICHLSIVYYIMCSINIYILGSFFTQIDTVVFVRDWQKFQI